MGRPAVIIAAALAAVVLAGCGSEGVTSPTPNTIVGKGAKAPQFPIVPAYHLKGSASAGRAVFASAGCGTCHTLAAAKSTGTVGPDLDQLKPSESAVQHQVENGGGAMPAFKGKLSAAQIQAVAQYVSSVAGK